MTVLRVVAALLVVAVSGVLSFGEQQLPNLAKPIEVQEAISLAKPIEVQESISVQNATKTTHFLLGMVTNDKKEHGHHLGDHHSPSKSHHHGGHHGSGGNHNKLEGHLHHIGGDKFHNHAHGHSLDKDEEKHHHGHHHGDHDPFTKLHHGHGHGEKLPHDLKHGLISAHDGGLLGLGGKLHEHSGHGGHKDEDKKGGHHHHKDHSHHQLAHLKSDDSSNETLEEPRPGFNFTKTLIDLSKRTDNLTKRLQNLQQIYNRSGILGVADHLAGDTKPEKDNRVINLTKVKVEHQDNGTSVLSASATTPFDSVDSKHLVLNLTSVMPHILGEVFTPITDENITSDKDLVTIHKPKEVLLNVTDVL
jgi:hypothetical protein